MSVDPTSGPRDVLAALRDGRIQGGEKRLRAAAQLMEGVFYQQLFNAMRDTVPEGGAISGSQGQEMFEGLLDERMAESAATSSEVGLGQALYRHFSRHIGIEPQDPVTETTKPDGA